ncbi:MAG: PEGA domain-containing protein [Deltaproteobacteria bacterium]|nr:PEGA domain-containing protein [Deltaproteobacteria bacterium]
MDKKRVVIIVLGIAALLIMTGCASQRVWTYTADPSVKTEPLVNKSVAVTPLADKRENVNHSMIGLMYIPVMPFGWMTLNTPEGGQQHITSGLWLFRPAEDIAKGIAEEINNSGIFKEAFFTNRASEGELNLRGNLTSTYYHGKLFSYCISSYGVYLWLIGFPAGSYKNNLEISFELVESSSGKILWSETYKKDFGKVFWMYAPGADFRYDQLLKDIMRDAIQSLKRDLPSGKSSQEQTQQKEASKDSGIISITSDPPGAKVFIDGEFKGQTPTEVSLSSGTHQIFLQRQLYKPYNESVSIEKGQTKTLNIKMSPEAGGQR